MRVYVVRICVMGIQVGYLYQGFKLSKKWGIKSSLKVNRGLTRDHLRSLEIDGEGAHFEFDRLTQAHLKSLEFNRRTWVILNSLERNGFLDFLDI
ncbi:hypothetical protein BKH46_06325 [Helicobacter sp. 12S02634-8]|uniref:hypothetical protein n=1 Tax=Helicobacter sp. 12S02634-8 TaxID=1476199 RepID=UPI000BA600B3|nr:hypothetical protein [Helicobacter sp. 12S02634-8]PAF46826.1 hypothetical protein BKH46_06325 [Helicobacter sp. 12S02634-8]